MKRLLFIPSYHYLSNPLFESILAAKPQWQSVFLQHNDPRFYRLNKNKSKSEALKDLFDEYHEIPIDDLLPWFSYYYRVVRDDIKPCSRFDLRRFFKYWEYQKRFYTLLEHLNPDGIIQATDIAYSSKLADGWAKKHGIPVFTIQPSFIDFVILKKRHTTLVKCKSIIKQYILKIPFEPVQPIFGNESSHGWLFVWGDYFREFYRGLPVYDRIKVTGNPVFDRLFQKVRSDPRDDHRKSLGVPPGKKVVIICSQYLKNVIEKELCNAIDHMYRELVRNRPDLYFIVKAHPREDPDALIRQFKNFSRENVQVIWDENLHDLYSFGDLQISVASYSSLEAVAFGLPIVLVNPENRVRLFDCFNGEVEERATSTGQLLEKVRRCLSETYQEEFKIKRERFLKSRLKYLDGKSGKRVVNTINEILENEKTRS